MKRIDEAEKKPKDQTDDACEDGNADEITRQKTGTPQYKRRQPPELEQRSHGSISSFLLIWSALGSGQERFPFLRIDPLFLQMHRHNANNISMTFFFS